MSSIQEILASIANAVYGKDVRQAIHDGVEMAYNKADNAETSAAAAADAASGSQESAAASAQAAANSASSASNSANQAEQYKNEAFHTTPAGYEAFVGEVNSSLDVLYNDGVKNILDISEKYYEKHENGVTFTLNSDGTVLANGTATSRSQIHFRIPANEAKTWAGKKISGVPTGQSDLKILVELEHTPYTNFAIDNGNGATISSAISSITDECAFIIRVEAGATVNNVLFKPMITDAEVPNSDYAHYVPFAQSNAALTEYTKGKVIYAHDIGSSETIATALNSVYSALQGLLDLEYAKVTLQVKIYNGGINSYKLSTSIGSKITFYSLMSSNNFRFIEITNSVSSCKFIANNDGTITDLSNLTDWANGLIRVVI